ncbi:MAG: hypothetical protein Q8O67_12770 [Deltaproteobacteria bacterium]|nr:hypothetical protein [Deltaproteobacteria bacterium]
MITIQGPLKVTDSEIATDGGSSSIYVVDGAGAQRVVTLVRSRDDPDRLPERLYVDGVIVPIRSPDEQAVLAALSAASCAKEHAPTLKSVVAVVSHQEYLKSVEAAFQEYKPYFEGIRRDVAQKKLWDEKTPAD